MSNVQLNAVLYYADFLSLKEVSKPVTDNCKYYFIYNFPMNAAYLVDNEPMYSTDNKYFKQALDEYNTITNKFGEDGALSFIDDICNLKSCGVVNAKRMLTYIHQYSTKKERIHAFNMYDKWLKDQIYTYTTIDEDGNPLELECTRYVAHYEKNNTKSKVYVGSRNGEEKPKETDATRQL